MVEVVADIPQRQAAERGLTLDSVTIERHPKGRARITNKIRISPAGVDGRSERGRRWRDIIDGLISAYGAGEPDKLRELATLKLSLEATQAAVINGDVLRSEDLVRLANLISRREKELRAAKHVASVTPSLAEKLALKHSRASSP